MTYTRPAHGDPGNDGSATDATVIVAALATGLEAVEAALPGKEAAGTAAAAVTAHEAAADPHPTYTTAAELAAALASYQPLDSDLTAIAALTTTSYGRAFLALVDAAAGRTALGLGTAATHAHGDYDAAGAAAAAQAASQPLDSDLTAIAALSTTAFGRSLLALADAAAAQAALGVPPTSRLVSAGSGLTGGGSLAADRTLAADFGTGAGKVTEGNDSRLSDARTPTAHVHAGADITSGTVAAARLPLATSGAQGVVPATGTPSGKFLKDDLTWATAGGGSGAQWLTGSGAPSGGNNGDFYLRDVDAALPYVLVYGPKTGGVWPSSPLTTLTRATNTSTGTSPGTSSQTPVYAARQNAYIPTTGGATGSDRLVVNTQYLTGPNGNTRLASGPAGISFKMPFDMTVLSSAPMLLLVAVSAQQVTLPTTGTQGVGLATCDALGAGPAGIVATTDSAGRLAIQGWGGAATYAQSSTGLVVAGDYISLSVVGGILTATCLDGSTNAAKGSLTCFMPTGWDAVWAVEVGMFWLNNGDGRQIMLRGSY